jgi:hypothetical protein
VLPPPPGLKEVGDPAISDLDCLNLDKGRALDGKGIGVQVDFDGLSHSRTQLEERSGLGMAAWQLWDLPYEEAILIPFHHDVECSTAHRCLRLNTAGGLEHFGGGGSCCGARCNGSWANRSCGMPNED